MKRLSVNINASPYGTQFFAQIGIESSGSRSLLSRKFVHGTGEFAEYERRDHEKQKNETVYC